MKYFKHVSLIILFFTLFCSKVFHWNKNSKILAFCWYRLGPVMQCASGRSTTLRHR